MTRGRDLAQLFGSLLVFWLLLNGQVSLDVVAVGIAVALAITVLFRGELAFIAEFRLTGPALVAALQYAVFFAKELVKANLSVARIVLAPSLPLTPGFVKTRTRLTSPVGRLLLANSITLTPGTLSVALEGEWLHVHWVSVESTDVEAATAAIVAGFEQYLEVMYG